MGLKSLFKTGSGAANRAARDATTARQGRASNLAGFVDSIFADPKREAGITDFMGAYRAQLGDATNRGFADISRGNKFATARRGLTGGSVDVSRQKRTLEDLFSRRIGDEAQVQDAGTDLRTQDMATRQSLLSSAYGAADVGQDAMRGLIGQRAQNANQFSSLLPRAFSNVAGGFADAYRGRRQGDISGAAAGGL